jgi:N-acyl-D-aspartate/D-glutamate deacylase
MHTQPSTEVVIRGGTVVDGTGAGPRTADVHLAEGRVVAVGRVDAPAGARVVDAAGALVLPGWVDIHAHYDGQATWDAQLAPSSWQGVTTVVMSNCGVGFAPVRPEHHDRLVELMEGVEDIPGTALHEGLPWTWESFPQYLDALDFPHDIDLATQAPHSAVRLFAMGERGSVHTETPTEDEIGAMAAVVRDAIAAGALGFSTSRTRNHRASTGEYIPSLTAGPAELVGIAEGVGAAGAGVLQVVSDFFDSPSEFDLLEAMARAAGRPLSFSLAQNNLQPDTWRELLRRTEAANDAGLRVRAQVATRAVGLVLGFECTLNPFSLNPEYRRLAAKLPFDERIRTLGDPAVRERILAAHTEVPNRGFTRFGAVYRFDAVPNYEPTAADSVAALAAAEGIDPAAWCYDHLLADSGRTMLYHPSLNWAGGDLDVVGEMLAHPYTVPGLGDGGAHVGTICDGSFPTFLLTHWVRDRAHGRLELADVVRRQCRETALAVGLTDRGALVPGLRADVNVVDLDALTIHRPAFAYDLPAGGKRLLQKATGYRHTFVAGVETYRDGEHTGALPGRLVRGGQ